MFEELTLSTVSTSTLLGFAIILILTGLLVPRRSLRDKQMEAERWREAYEAERTARAIADAQTSELLEVARTTHSIVVAMAQASTRIRESGDSNAPTQT